MEDRKIQEKFKEYLKKEETKKIIKIVLCVIGGIAILGAGAYIVYKLFFDKEDDYDLYDELDFYYDEDDEAEAEEETGCCSGEAEETAEGCCCTEA